MGINQTRIREGKMASKDQIIKDIGELFSDERFSLDEALTNMQEISDVVTTNIDALDEDIGVRDMGE